MGLTVLAAMMGCFTAAAPAESMLQPVPFNQVVITGGFWSPWIALTHDKILPHNLAFCESEGKIDNFRIVAGKKEGKHRGAVWEDSDVYKVIEGAAYCLMHQRDAAIETQIDAIIELIAASQQPDGYLNTYFTLVEPQNRWKDDSKHETYCAGHLIEGALAYYQATNKRVLLDTAIRVADHMCDVFGPGKVEEVPQHEEVELALIKLWRFSGQERYLDLAKWFLERRGLPYHKEKAGRWGEVCQDHKPIREQDEIFGHAVRAMYLYSAVTDVAALTQDPGYLHTLDSIWQDITQRKMYITGGLGDSSRSNEGFSAPYFLPNDTAYSETCASVGLILWNQRMALLHADAKYADIIERALYNCPLSCVSREGTGFFYCNRLAGSDRRPPWQGCACCPTNMVRFLPTVAGYAYATGEQRLYINQYLGSEAKLTVAGQPVRIVQETDYPWDGAIRISLHPEKAAAFAVHMRIPAWCEGPTSPEDLYFAPGKPERGAAQLVLNSASTGDLVKKNGYAVLDRTWNPGDIVELTLPMPVQRMKAHPKIEADAGRIALQRGPIVYCLEAVDNQRAVASLALPADAPLSTERLPDLLGGVAVVKGTGLSRSESDPAPAPMPFTAIPYYAWSNRAKGHMQVWIPEDVSLAQPRPTPTIANRSVAATSFPNNDTADAMNDQIEPKNSADMSIPRMTWWDKRGTQEWVEYAFDEPHAVQAAEVYWFDDTGTGSCRIPASWRLFYKDGDAWKPVDNKTAYGTAANQYNRVEFAPVTTSGLRLEAQLQPSVSGGILEWRVLGK